MPRRISSGQAGGARLAGLQAIGTTLTALNDLDIVLDPTGTGRVLVDGDAQLQTQSVLRLNDADNSHYVGFRAPSTIATDVTWTLPSTDGSANQSLTTNASGTLQWTTTSLAIANETADASTHFLTFTTSSSGTITAARVSNTGLSFQPSTSTLVVNGTFNSLRTENITTISKTIQLIDRDRVVVCNNTSNITITIPNDSTLNFPVGSVVHIARVNTGEVTIAVQAPATVTRSGDMYTAEEIYVRKRAANTWILVDAPPPTLTGTGGTTSTAGGFTSHAYSSTGASTFTVS